MQSIRGRWLRARRRSLVGSWLVLSAALLAGAPARAIEVVVGVGDYDVLEGQGNGPVEASVGLRLTGTEVWRSKRGMVLVPAFGAMGTDQNASYAWGGGALMVRLGSRWGLIPEVGAGYYHRGDGKNLGGSLEFRSGLEATYRANDTVRVGVGFYHLSNAGLHDINPGVNSLVLTFGVRPKSRDRVWDTADLR